MAKEIFFSFEFYFCGDLTLINRTTKKTLKLHMNNTQGFYFLTLALNRRDSNGMRSHPLDLKTGFSLETLTALRILDMTWMLRDLIDGSYGCLHKVKSEFLHEIGGVSKNKHLLEKQLAADGC